MVGEPHRLGPLPVGVPRQEGVDVALGLAQQRLGEGAQEASLGRRALAQVQQHVGDDLVVAAAGGVQAPARVAHQLCEPPLDRRVDVLVPLAEGEVPARQLVLDAREAGRDGVGVLAGDDPLCGQHARVRPRGRQVLGPEAAVDVERGVEAVERLGRPGREAPAPEARALAHGRTAARADADRRAATASARAPQTRSTWASVISGKNGSAMVEALIASVTGSSPGRCPWTSW